jgi:hypothetical protein
MDAGFHRSPRYGCDGRIDVFFESTNIHIATPMALPKTGPRTISQTLKFNKRNTVARQASIP